MDERSYFIGGFFREKESQIFVLFEKKKKFYATNFQLFFLILIGRTIEKKTHFL